MKNHLHSSDEKVPLISVLVCNYNYGRYIAQCLDSIFAQDYPNLEVVVVDDGSGDDSVGTITEYVRNNDSRPIKTVFQKKNRGICFARNEAIENASGDFFVFVDSDDTIPQDYLSAFYATHIQTSADVIYGDAKMFGDQEGVTDYPAFSRDVLLIRNIINISSLTRRSAVGSSRFDTALNRQTSEDYDFWLGLALKGLTFAKCDTAYLNYRIQDTSRNGNEGTVGERIMQFVDTWRYSLDKYRPLLQEGEYESAVFGELEFRVREISGELSSLNHEVHKVLAPEIKRRGEHIDHLNDVIAHADHSRESLALRLEQIERSRAYRVGVKIAEPYRRLKDTFRGRR